MPFLDDSIYDSGLDTLTGESGAADLYLCSQEPTTAAEANTTYALANKTNVTIGAAGDASGVRRVTISAFSDGVVSTSGTASHWAIVNGAGSTLLATGTLASSVAVSSGNTFTLNAININLAKPPVAV